MSAPLDASAAMYAAIQEEAIMLRKVLHVAYHFVTVADEAPRHIVHTD
jgi:hypothetical protein